MVIYKGQRLRLAPIHLVDALGLLIKGDNTWPCEVIYVHRKHRFFTVAFEFPGGTVRESYKLEAGDRIEV